MVRQLVTLAFAVLACCGGARAQQIRQDQVLVIYDSRVADSLAVAEYYAGSAKVPGGVGGIAGARQGVRVMNLANQTASATTGADVSYATFISAFRTPIRNFLNDPVSPSATANPARNIITKVRCLVTTRGLPHRIQDINNATAGDNPPVAGNMVNAGNYTAAALDSELTLLWQNLSAGEANGDSDSKADNVVVNPYWRATVPMAVNDNRNITVAKTFTLVTSGVGWSAPGTGSTSLRAGDMYLVSRLDAGSLQGVRDMIDRAANVYVDVNNSVFVLDESNSNGVADTTTNAEFDNQGPSETWGGDDFEQTRDAITTDKRFLTSNIRYDAAPGAANFIVGPKINYGGGIVVSGNVLLLATEGANHNGGTPGGAGSSYPFSFNYARGAVMNSIESYNGRAYNGLSNGFGQADTSSFLSNGGTFAIGNVWEPFTFSIADNLQIAKNFFLGNLTWGEAAMTSLPCVSFQQMILGDPLARVVRSSEDVNGDQYLTIDDLHAWNVTRTDINRSGVADATDRRILETSLRQNEILDMAGAQR